MGLQKAKRGMEGVAVQDRRDMIYVLPHIGHGEVILSA